MWKLTITQKKKSEYSNYETDNSIEYVSDDVSELVAVVGRLANSFSLSKPTTYKIEKMEEDKDAEV